MDSIMSPKSANPLQVELVLGFQSVADLYLDEKTNDKKRWGNTECNTNATLPEMSDRIVSPQYSCHSGPYSLEACIKVFSLYQLQCWILQPAPTDFGVKTPVDDEKQWINKWCNIQTGENKIIRTSHGAGVITLSRPCVCNDVCACISTVRVCPCECQMDIQCWVGHTETVA